MVRQCYSFPAKEATGCYTFSLGAPGGGYDAAKSHCQRHSWRRPGGRAGGIGARLNPRARQPSQQSLTPAQLLSTLESIFTTLETGEITDPTVRNEGLCLLEGFYAPFSHSVLRALYPAHSDYVSRYTAARGTDRMRPG